MPFEFLTLTKAKLNSVNVRSEKHGLELVPAIDLKLTIDSSNDILKKFHADLLPSVYFKAAPDDGEQQALDGIEPATTLPNLKFPKLDGPLKWDLMGAGYILVLDYGLGGASNLELHGCEVNNFAFTCKEGGTVELQFRVQLTNVDEKIAGKLCTLAQHEVSITLTAPTPADVEDLTKPMENPFFDADPVPLDGKDEDDDAPLFPQTPEEALIASAA